MRSGRPTSPSSSSAATCGAHPASLVPADYDPSVLLTTAGMHPLKPYFLGQERPPRNRLTSCQKCFRTTDIENVGNTARHLTFFEMLGNFSLGDYFKQGAVEQAWQLSLDGFGFKAGDIWITVFEGDKELGLGPDEEAIAAWESVGVPRDRIVLCPRSENFWQAGPTGPCGPVLGALPGPRRRVRLARGPPRRRERALPRVLEPRVHAVQPGSDRDAHAAAEPEHRHRPGPEPHGAHPAGRADDLRDRPVRAAHGAGPGALAARRARGARAAHPGRPLARDDVPHRRRRRAVQRGPRVHPAPGHAPRDPAGPSHRHRAGLHAAVRRRRRRRHGRRVPGARGRARPRQPLGEGGGGGLRPHAGAGHASCSRRSSQRSRRGRLDPRGGRVPPARHVRLPLRGDPRARARAGPRGRHRGLRLAHGAAAGACACRRPRRVVAQRRPAGAGDRSGQDLGADRLHRLRGARAAHDGRRASRRTARR